MTYQPLPSSDGKMMVSGTVTANIAGTVPVSGTFWPPTQPVSGTVTVGNASLPVTGTFWQTTQPVSGTLAITAAALPLPSGAATETTLSALNTKTPALGQAAMAASQPVVIASNQSALSVTGTFWQATQPISGTVTIGNASLAVTGPLTDTQLRATALPISGSISVSNFPVSQAVTGTFFQATQPVSIAATVAVSAASLPLPSGAATEATVAAISTKTPAFGQALMAASSPVVIASNQSAVPFQPATPTPFNMTSAASTNLTSVRAAAATLYMVAYSNVGAAAAYVKLYNKASAPVVATDVPVITLPMGAATASSINLGALGHRFTTGIALAITMGSADTDATAIAANQVKVMLDYV